MPGHAVGAPEISVECMSQSNNYGREHLFNYNYESGVALNDFLRSLLNDLFLCVAPRALQMIH